MENVKSESTKSTAPTPADRIAELEALVAKLLARIRYLENIWMERFGELE